MLTWHKQVDWSKLKLTMLHPSCMYSIAPWVVSLKVVDNHLRMLPSEIFSATQLRRLDLSHNLLETMSANLFALPNLEYLSLSHNRLKEVPETSNWSAFLLHLDLSVNLLGTLPQGIQHSSIEMLNLSRNQFTLVPKCLCRIHTLTSLDLSYMPISFFPKEMEQLDHLVNLKYQDYDHWPPQWRGSAARGEQGNIHGPGTFQQAMQPCQVGILLSLRQCQTSDTLQIEVPV